MSTSPKIPTTTVPSEPYVRPAVTRPNVLRLDGNEGRYPPKELLTMLAQQEIAMLRDYPDPRLLEAAIATRFEVAPERVVVTAGADDALDRVCRAFVTRGRAMVMPVPTFEMLRRFAAATGGDIVEIPWNDEYPTDDVVQSIGPETALVVMVSPNNPTGQTAKTDDLRRVADAATSALVLLDHVYVEYADDDLTRPALERENVIVVRTFSKAWGLAGCRVGYVLASPEVASIIRNAGNPYPVSGMSIAVVQDQLGSDATALDTHVARVVHEREQLRVILHDLGVPTRPSQANFVLADGGSRASFLYDGLAACDVLVRRFLHRPEIASGLRITLPADENDFARLERALQTCLAPEALLFDLDGVLANVEDSYRRCTLETARSFGAHIERHELARAVRAGNANNDWVLTQWLLAQRGIEVSLEAVIERYQAMYLGTDGSPGYREGESLLVTPTTLRDLARALPLGVVTGRPREEAQWFLQRFEIRDCFDTVVCMEDAPNKPNPRPVRLALERLGVTRAWMLGDTPDDIRAARAAGVLPLGVVAPGEDRAAAVDVLEREGAVVLQSVASLRSILP